MKSNFTNLLRNSILTLLLSVAFTSAFSQTGKSNTTVSNLKVSVQNDRLTINWNVTETPTANYCEVQSSKDGINFSTVGLVMGADPKQTNNGFAFKQDLKKIKPGQVYYRVLAVETDNTSYASNVISVK